MVSFSILIHFFKRLICFDTDLKFTVSVNFLKLHRFVNGTLPIPRVKGGHFT